MAQIFPEWTNKLPTYIAISVVILFVAIVAIFWYYGSAWYSDVGYRPTQPIPYSHKLHAGDLGLDCRYCHSSIERSPVANIPPTQTCMNCHKFILRDSDLLLPVRESWETKNPIKWIQVHKLPDFVYFDHSIHLYAGVGCFSCHGNIAEMPVVTQNQPLSMSWCLDCHRHPEMALRPADQITSMDWAPSSNQKEFAAQVISDKKLKSPTACTGCHR